MFGPTLYNVAVRYRTPRDGYTTKRYGIWADTAAAAKQSALMLAYKIRGSTMHEAEITDA